MRNHHHDSGFTLAETLVALSLTLMVITAGIETFQRSMRLFGTSRVMSETDHGLQAGMSLMTRDFIQTGQGIPIGGIPIPGGTGALAILRPGPSSTMTFTAGASTLPALSPGDGLGPTLLGVATDLVTILIADQTLAINTNTLTAIAADGSTMTVNAATPVTGVGGIKAGDIILFSNSRGNAIQMVTTTPTTQVVQFAASDALRLNQRTVPQGTIMNLASSPGVYPPTTATRILMVTYYLDVTTDPTMPRLVRRVNAGSPLAVALGAENLQITYDIVDGVTNPSNVNTPTGSNSANQIRKANLFLAAKSQDVNPQTHQYFRNSMATQVALRSLSFYNTYN